MDLNFPQAEAAVLGAILIDPDKVLPRLVEDLRPEDFFDPTLRHLFSAARDLYLSKKPVDPVTIGAAAGASDAYGAVAAQLMATTPSAANVNEYAAIVRDRARLRDLQAAGLELSQCRTLDEARAAISRAADLSADTRKAESRLWRDVAMAFVESLSKEPDEYLDLGIDKLTETARIQAGQFVVLGAYNSVGKTALALQMAFAIAKSGKRVGFFSLETLDLLLARRIFAQQTGTRLKSFQAHTLQDDELRRSADLIDRSWDYYLEFFPAAGYTAADIRARTLSHRLDIAFVDYVQLMASEGESPALQVRASSMGLHTMAQQLGVTVFALSQVTLPPRDQRGRRPPLRKENLRESQQLANDADVVFLLDLSDPDDYESNRVLMMDKNKDVGQARMLLRFDGPRVTFAYQPPLSDGGDERVAAMDRNREERKRKRAAQQAEAEAEEGAFEELEGRGEDLPF